MMNLPRIGFGFDVHKFASDRKLILCGVEVPADQGLLGHSDADVATHALIDALLGAAALGDIGKLFPDTDNRYKDIDSFILLSKTMEKVGAEGLKIGNIDITIVAQAPKLSPYIQRMRERLSEALEVGVESVSVKATTTEHLGFTGRKEGMAAYAVALLYK